MEFKPLDLSELPERRQSGTAYISLDNHGVLKISPLAEFKMRIKSVDVINFFRNNNEWYIAKANEGFQVKVRRQGAGHILAYTARNRVDALKLKLGGKEGEVLKFLVLEPEEWMAKEYFKLSKIK